MGISNITGEKEEHHGNLSSGNSVEGEEQEVEQNKHHDQLLNHFLYGSPNGDDDQTNSHIGSTSSLQQQRVKKKRNLPGTPGKFRSPALLLCR